MTTRIKLRRDTAANWLTANPILAAGEPGLETDTGKIKYGDGVTAYADLPHAGGDTLNDEGGVVVTAGSTNHWQALQRREDQNTYGRGVRHDSNGNVYALTKTSDGGDVAIITKYSNTGAVLWQHTIDEMDPYSLAVDSSDCVYIAGENNDDGNTIDVWKFNTSGSVLWKKNYDGGAWTGECFIEERTSTRLTLVANRDNGDYGVIVLDINTTTGAVVTKKLINLDGPLEVWCAGIDTDEDGNVFITGRYYYSETDRFKMFIEKLDSNLERVWSKSLDTETSWQMTAGDCASDGQGNVYAVAYYTVDVNTAEDGNALGTVGILIKLNSAGATQWTRRMGPGPCNNGVIGLTATPVGDLYLSTITITPSTNPQLTDGQKYAEGDIRMIVSKHNTAGEVVWQRYIDDDHTWEINDTFRGQAISVYDDVFVTDYYGNSTNVRQINYSSVDDNEMECYIVQLPTSGTDLEIGTMSFKASRIPGRFITQAVTTSPLFLDTFSDTVTVVDSGLPIDEQDRIANSLIRSEAYDYVFGADGTLTMPNDGDIKLTQSQVGFLATIGGINNNWGNIQNYAVAVDSDGFMYAGGEEYNSYDPYVSKISPEGERVWSVRIINDNNGNAGGVRAMAIHPNTGNLLVTCNFWGSYQFATVVTLDPDTGRILANAEYKDDNSDVAIRELSFLNTGDWVAVGSKNSEFSAEQAVTPLEGSTTQRLIIARNDVDGQMNGTWQIGGTGFSAFEQIGAVEQWSNLTSTTDEASGNGAQITVRNVGDGTYNVGTIPVPGTGYQVGRFLKVLGTDVGGATPTNDVIVKVSSIDGSGGVASVELMSGTAAGTTDTNYPSVAANRILGSGFTFGSFSGPVTSNNYADRQTFSGGPPGEKYAVGDVIRFAGTQLGGTTPTNDLLVTVNAVDYYGSVTDFTISGTAQSTTWNITTNTNVDFSQQGSWQFIRPLSRENLLLTPNWQRTYGTNTGDYTDETMAVAVDSGGNIITVGMGYGIVTAQDSRDLAMVYKFNSSGTLQWARKLNFNTNGCSAKSVTTIGTDIYVTHNEDGNNTVITKLSADGTIQWQRTTDSNGDNDSVVVPAGDGDILVMTQSYQNDISDDMMKIFKITASGETVYKRWFAAVTDNDTRLYTGRNMAVRNGSMYIAGHYDTNNYNSTWLARLPVDGTGTGEYGQFRYSGTNQESGSYNYWNLPNVEYQINEVYGSYAGSLTVEPYVNTTDMGLATEGDYIIDSFYENYYTQPVRDIGGGRIVFPDGTTQDTSAIDVPQNIYRGERYVLGLKDRGHHIYCTESNDNITIPYYARVPFPVGSQIVIVNDTGNNVYVYTEGSSISVILSGDGGSYSGFYLNNGNVATLLNVGRDRWFFYGDVNYD